MFLSISYTHQIASVYKISLINQCKLLENELGIDSVLQKCLYASKLYCCCNENGIIQYWLQEVIRHDHVGVQCGTRPLI